MAVAVGSGHAKPPTTITTTCAKLRIKMRPIMEEGYEKKKKHRMPQAIDNQTGGANNHTITIQ